MTRLTASLYWYKGNRFLYLRGYALGGQWASVPAEGLIAVPTMERT